jgi:hypothetical protein
VQRHSLTINPEDKVLQNTLGVHLPFSLGDRAIMIRVDASNHGGGNGDTGYKPHCAANMVLFKREDRCLQVFIEAMRRGRVWQKKSQCCAEEK